MANFPQGSLGHRSQRAIVDSYLVVLGWEDLSSHTCSLFYFKNNVKDGNEIGGVRIHESKNSAVNLTENIPLGDSCPTLVWPVQLKLYSGNEQKHTPLPRLVQLAIGNTSDCHSLPPA